MFFKVDSLKCLQSSPEKYLCWSLFLKKLGTQASNFITKKLQHRLFSVKFAAFKVSYGNNFSKDFLATSLLYNKSSPATLAMTNKFENVFTYQKLVPIEHLNINNFTALLHF